MFRRSFMTRLAMGSAAAAGGVNASDSKTVTYKITGFSCVTCAVGLDTMLQQQDGVIRSQSSYPETTSKIEFKPSVTNEKTLKKFISEMGFTAI
jgi:Cu+-exporting ATPase